MTKKPNSTESKDSAQLSLLDELIAQLNNAGSTLTSKQIAAAIDNNDVTPPWGKIARIQV